MTSLYLTRKVFGANFNFFFYINESTLYKQQIQITCLRLRIYGIDPVSNRI